MDRPDLTHSGGGNVQANITHQFALEQYRQRACVYDLELAAFESIRTSAVARLDLVAGAVVLDIGCGTGLSFSLIQQAVGPRGAIVGIEQCPEMLEQARKRVSQHAWNNVTLLHAPVAAAPITCLGDAALFHFTHDILRDKAAICNVVQCLKPGARVVASGLQWASPWAWVINCFVLAAAYHSTTSFDGLDRPWSVLEEQIGGLSVSSTLFGAVFTASGVCSGRKGC